MPWASLLLLTALLAGLGPRSACASDAPLRMGVSSLQLGHEGCRLAISLRCPRFILDGQTVGGTEPTARPGAVESGRPAEIGFAPLPLGPGGSLEVRLYLQWFPAESVLRKWASFRLVAAPAPVLVKEIILDDIDVAKAQTELLARQPVVQPPFSYPVLLRAFFTGVEFPISSTRVEQGRVLLAHQPGLRMRPGVTYRTRTAVYGMTPVGGEWERFRSYVEAHRPTPKGRLINYNHWWSTPVRATEADILGLMRTFRDKLYRPYGVAFDTFCIDVGWSERQSVWEMDRVDFPDGFRRARATAAQMGTALGIWVSPSSVYPSATDPQWLGQSGYETVAIPWGDGKQVGGCLGGRRYQGKFQQSIVDMVTRYGLGSSKFDGYLPTCPSSDHGHEPGALSAEPIADGMIAVFAAARRANPRIWLRPTCFGWNPSPWWLFYTNSVIGDHGDDSPYGRVPSPVYRESYTSARDYYNLQGACHSPVPLAAEEVLGLCHQTPEPFMNDGVMVVMRGHSFLPLYFNPKYMDSRRWAQFAGLLTWARRNADILLDTRPLPPVSWQGDRVPRFEDAPAMPREPYGYAHGSGTRCLVVLRNPWIAPASYALRLDESCGLSGGVGDLSAVSLYPEPRVYARGARLGDVVQVPLAPYETVVLSIARHQPARGLPAAGVALAGTVQVSPIRQSVRRVEFMGRPGAFGPDWTSLVGTESTGLHCSLEGSIRVSAPDARLLVLLEGTRSPLAPAVRLVVNGRDAVLRSLPSDAGWAASGLPVREHWTFLEAPLGPGDSEVAFDLLAGAECARISAWVWARKPGAAASHYPNALPAPELVSLDGACLLAPAEIATLKSDPLRMDRPVETINGVFLDTLDPVSIKQGWGTLQRNQSVWEKPMTIAGKAYVRGLGTSSQTRIVYALDGRYRRFQSWVGADGATNPTITFEVWVDGRKAWETGLMTRETPPRRVDIEVSGAKRLELVIGDGGNGIVADHADWAEARLLR